MKFWYKGNKWKPIKSYKIITKGKHKGQVEITFNQYTEKTMFVYPSQTQGIPEFEKKKV